jgi:hypothetical protein
LTRGLAVFVGLALAATLGHGAAALGQPGVRPTDQTLAEYVASQARAWAARTTPDGRVIDPLDPADSGDNYGVILLADVMLRVAARDDDPSLAETAEHIVQKAETLAPVTGPFNLLAIGLLLRDGERSSFPAPAWQRLSAGVARLAARVGRDPRRDCLTAVGCYSNWRLVWSAGAGALLAPGVDSNAALAIGGASSVSDQVARDLRLAAAHVSPPISGAQTGGEAAELSDPGSEPQSYEMLSAIMLALIEEVDPSAITPAIARLTAEVDRYALLMMAPDGQLSLSGRSLDQSWVQAAGVDLGYRRASTNGAEWRSFGTRSLAYLLSAYPDVGGGLTATVPGLASEWNRSLVDPYAAFAQCSGLALWFASDALAHSSPARAAAERPLPADRASLLLSDIRSSGAVWGRAAGVWWELRARATGGDPRLAQGLVAIKRRTGGGWRDLLALRPRERGLESTWTLSVRGGRVAHPTFTRVEGSGAHAVLRGFYLDAHGRPLAPATWTVARAGGGVSFTMTKPPASTLTTTVWTAGRDAHLETRGALRKRPCLVTASGPACPETVVWGRRARAAILRVS